MFESVIFGLLVWAIVIALFFLYCLAYHCVCKRFSMGILYGDSSVLLAKIKT